MNYRWEWEDGCFLVSASCVTISNPDSLSSSETGVNPEIRSWKSAHLMSLISEYPWWYLVLKEVKSWDSTNRFRIGKFLNPGFKPYFQHFQMHLLVERFFFGGILKKIWNLCSDCVENHSCLTSLIWFVCRLAKATGWTKACPWSTARKKPTLLPRCTNSRRLLTSSSLIQLFPVRSSFTN
jgi:hypothetical protein